MAIDRHLVLLSKFKRVLIILIIAHVIFSMVLIFFPAISFGGITKVYRKYLLPGPFFTADRIEQSYSLKISYKTKDIWSGFEEPALNNYQRFLESGNMNGLIQSRLDRYFYYQYIITRYRNPESVKNKEFKQLQGYFCEFYIPEKADSIRFIFLHKKVSGYQIKSDTLYSIKETCR